MKKRYEAELVLKSGKKFAITLSEDRTFGTFPASDFTDKVIWKFLLRDDEVNIIVSGSSIDYILATAKEAK
jgi:hypothetical protein